MSWCWVDGGGDGWWGWGWGWCWGLPFDLEDTLRVPGEGKSDAV